MFQGCYKAGKGLRLIISTAGLMDGTLMAAYCLSLDMSGRRMADEKMLRRLPKLILNVQLVALETTTPKFAPDLRSHTILILNCVNPDPHTRKTSPLFPFRIQKPATGRKRIMVDNPIMRMAATMIDKWSSPIWTDKLMS